MNSPTTTVEKTEAQKMATQYREIAKWLEQHPDLPVVAEGSALTVRKIYGFAEIGTNDEVRAQCAAVAKMLGRSEKDYNDTWFMLRAEIAPSVEYEFNANREQVCRKKFVGMETVTLPATPARPAQPAQPERTGEREKFEWECVGILDPDAQGRA